jgi:hypothetical protein
MGRMILRTCWPTRLPSSLTWFLLVGLVVSTAGVGQVPRLNAAFSLGPGGSLTSVASEVISGRSSVKGASVPGETITNFFHSNRAALPLSPGGTYTVTFKYRILAAGGFALSFYSPTASSAGNDGVSSGITGNVGDSGARTLTATLGPYADYDLAWAIIGAGSIAIDDVLVVNAGTGATLIAEGAEGPTIDSGPLNFHLVEARSLPVGPSGQSYSLRSATVQDLDADGNNEIVLTITTYPDQLP